MRRNLLLLLQINVVITIDYWMQIIFQHEIISLWLAGRDTFILLMSVVEIKI